MNVVSSHSSGTGPIMHHELPTADALEAKLVVERDSASALRDEVYMLPAADALEAKQHITSSTQDNH